MKRNLFFLCVVTVLNTEIFAGQTPPQEGNFALPSSQEQGPLFGFGQNIIGKKDLQSYLYVDYIQARPEQSSNIMPGLLYGIRDDLSIFVNIPITVSKGPLPPSTSAGVSVQVEYAYYSRESSSSEIQATVLAGLSGPNGSMIKQTISNDQSSTFFLGGTLNYMSVEWYAYGALGELFAIKHKSTKQGDNFLYQFALGRNLHRSQKHIYACLVEFLGARFKADSINGVIDPESSGDLIFLSPSLWISSEKFILQCGLSLPIYQNFTGKNIKYDFQCAVNIAWTF